MKRKNICSVLFLFLCYKVKSIRPEGLGKINFAVEVDDEFFSDGQANPGPKGPQPKRFENGPKMNNVMPQTFMYKFPNTSRYAKALGKIQPMPGALRRSNRQIGLPIYQPQFPGKSYRSYPQSYRQSKLSVNPGPKAQIKPNMGQGEESKPGSIGESFHNPAKPNFELLLNQMKPIIPGKFENQPHKMSSPYRMAAESPYSPFLKNIIKLSKDLKLKMNPKAGGKQDKLLLLIAQTAQKMLARDDVNQAELTGLMGLFNEYFNEPRTQMRNLVKHGEGNKAPFSKLGEDCFSDVDHQKIALEIKRMALNLASYLKSRMKESVGGSGESGKSGRPGGLGRPAGPGIPKAFRGGSFGESGPGGSGGYKGPPGKSGGHEGHGGTPSGGHGGSPSGGQGGSDSRRGSGGDNESVKFKTDAVLTQLVANMAKLHRAVLRNWHHILMMIGNFAGPNIEVESENNEKTEEKDDAENKYSKYNQPNKAGKLKPDKTGDEKDKPKKAEKTEKSKDSEKSKTKAEKSEDDEDAETPEDEDTTKDRRRKKREVENKIDEKEVLEQVQDWIDEMELMLSIKEFEPVNKNSLQDYPDVLCGTSLKKKTLESHKITQNCLASDSWFLDQICRSVITDPDFECYPPDKWILVHGQRAYKIDTEGAWFFTVSFAITRDTLPKESLHKDKISKENLFGQLIKVSPKTQKLETLLQIENSLALPRETEKETTLQLSVEGDFKTGDLIMLRMVPVNFDISVTINGIREIEEPLISKGMTGID